jgi:hypothetical protein
MIVGSQSSQYLDYDHDGQIDNGEVDGYGSLPNGNQAGYLQDTAQQARAASESPDSTLNIRQQGQYLQACVQNMKDWTDEILPLALKLNEISFGPAMKPIIDQLSQLGNSLLNGTDTNKNGQVEAIQGECGAELAYKYGTYMADFTIYPGPNRIPPTGK